MNKVILIGRFVRDPELRKTQSDISVATFTLAVDRPGAKGTADFINCTAWRGAGEVVAKYFTKGNRVAVTGYLTSRSYEDKAGNKRTVYEVVVDQVEFVESKSEASKPHTNDSGFSEVSDDSDLPF